MTSDVLTATLSPHYQARNLVYMVQKRERMKKQILRSQAELFQLESALLEEEAEEAEEERERERERQEQELLLAQSVRQTRYRRSYTF